MLEEDRGRDEVLYVHQLLQEYFAARQLARAPQAELVQQEWRAERVVPSLQATLHDLADADPLPPLPTTGWEETTVLAAAMARDPERFVTALMPQNLALAGRCAAQPEVRISEATEGQSALGAGGTDPGPQLLICGHALPRASLSASSAIRVSCAGKGLYGAYLLPPLIDIPGGIVSHR